MVTLSSFISQFNIWVSKGNTLIFCSTSKDIIKFLNFLKRRNYIKGFSCYGSDTCCIYLYPNRSFKVKMLKRKYYNHQQLFSKYEEENKPMELVFSVSALGWVSYHDIISSDCGGIALFKIESNWINQ